MVSGRAGRRRSNICSRDVAAPLVGLGLAGQREAEPLVEAARGIEAGKGGEPDALVAALVAEADRAAEKVGAEPVALHLLADDEPARCAPCGPPPVWSMMTDATASPSE